jgi:hypothetical protein
MPQADHSIEFKRTMSNSKLAFAFISMVIVIQSSEELMLSELSLFEGIAERY